MKASREDGLYRESLGRIRIYSIVEQEIMSFDPYVSAYFNYCVRCDVAPQGFVLARLRML